MNRMEEPNQLDGNKVPQADKIKGIAPEVLSKLSSSMELINSLSSRLAQMKKEIDDNEKKFMGVMDQLGKPSVNFHNMAGRVQASVEPAIGPFPSETAMKVYQPAQDPVVFKEREDYSNETTEDKRARVMKFLGIPCFIAYQTMPLNF